MFASDPKLTAVILVISDTAYEDSSTDKAGPVLTEVFKNDGGGQWIVLETSIVSDDKRKIEDYVTRKSRAQEEVEEDAVNLIVTTGGTGFAQRDVTPEVISPLIHRHAPGLVHGMLAASFEVTPFAMMARPVAGVRNNTLIVTLPGSPKGAKENLQAILKLLPHACLQAAGGDSRMLHAGGIKKLEKDAGLIPQEASGNDSETPNQHRNHHHHGHDHSHAHGHGSHAIPQAHTTPSERPISNDPRAGPTRRHRESPYPMLSVSDATALILKHTPQPKPISRPVNTSLVGYVLAEDVTASEAVPAFRASIVDGYAVIVSKEGEEGLGTKGVFPVTSVSHATTGGEIAPLQKGEIARITTGAPLPPGATSVVMVEDTVLRSMKGSAGNREEQEQVDEEETEEEEGKVEILTNAIKDGENVREIGSDIKANETILTKGEEITTIGGELGLLASVGKADVCVYAKPTVGVLSTGDEIVPHDQPGPLKLGQVRDCNRTSLMAAIQGWGFEVLDLGIAADTPGALESTLRKAMRACDVLVTSGGVSMGELDLLKPTIERSLGGTIHIGRVAMKPGKPTTFATVPFKNNDGVRSENKLVFSLPGNPASALVTAHLFVLPALHRYMGVANGREGLSRVKVRLDAEVKCDPKRAEYVRIVVQQSGEDGLLHAVTTGGQRSSRVGSLRSSNALLCLPAREGTMGKGKSVDALLMGKVVGVR